MMMRIQKNRQNLLSRIPLRINLFISLLSLLIILSGNLKAQKHALELRTDNDLYLSTYNDGYYTNGLFFSYSFHTKSKKETIHTISEFGINHEMYNSYKATVWLPEEHDRPFAAALYANFSKQYTSNSQQLFRWNIKMGVIGKKAFGKELQEIVHFFYKTRAIVGWNYQIADAPIFNLDLHYMYPLFLSKRWSIHTVNNLELGSLRSNIKSGFYARYGITPLTSLFHSMAFKNNLNSHKEKAHECFLFFKTQLQYQYYDATIQGSFFNHTSPITFPLKPFVLETNLGVCFTLKHFNASYVAHLYTQRLKNSLIENYHYYGSLHLAYLF